METAKRKSHRRVGERKLTIPGAHRLDNLVIVIYHIRSSGFYSSKPRTVAVGFYLCCPGHDRVRAYSTLLASLTEFRVASSSHRLERVSPQLAGQQKNEENNPHQSASRVNAAQSRVETWRSHDGLSLGDLRRRKN